MAADVNKAACKFVEDFAKYVKCGKYNLCCSLAEAKQAYGIYKQIENACDTTNLEEAACATDNYSTTICSTGVTTADCADQTSITFEVVPVTCSTTISLKNSADNSSYARLTPAADTVYQTAKINLVKADTCGSGSSTQLTSSTCYTAVRAVLKDVVAANPNGYIKELTIYATSNTGGNPLVAYTVDVSPSNVATWNVCTGCDTINPLNLVFGSASYTTEMAKLMNNVSKTLFGTGTGDWYVDKLSDYIRISSKVKHNPSTLWSGINADDCTIKWVNQSGVTVTNTLVPRSANLNVNGTMVNSFNAPYSIATTCGTVSGTIVASNLYYDVKSSESNFNYLKMVTGNSNTPVTGSFPNTACTGKSVTAEVTTTGTVASKVWKDPSLTNVGTDYTYTTTGTGVYTFSVTTANGCTTQETITL